MSSYGWYEKSLRRSQLLTCTQQLALKGSIWGHMYISKDHKKVKAHLWIAGYFLNVLGGVFLWTKMYKSMVIFDTRQKIADVSYFFDKYG